jgi:hypothetical protein
MMRALLIDDIAKAKVAKVVSYAMDHPYTPFISPIPGENPNHVADLNTYRCVFTFTRAEGRLYRHLTISVPKQQKYPNPIAAFMIAELFGFTGYNEKEPSRPGLNWIIDINNEENCVMLAQET